MKTLLETISGFDSSNAAEIAKLHNLIEHYTHANRCEVEGVSLITVRDLVKYSDDKLRENGYAITLAQFREDCAKYLALAAKDPILYNSRLKRLHRSYTTFEDAFISGRIYNKAVLEEMQAHFAKTLKQCYSHGDINDKKMPVELAQRIASLLDAEICSFNKMWSTNAISPELAREYIKSFQAQFVAKWRAGLLPQCISQCLDAEKRHLNSVERLLHCFRTNQLTPDINAQIVEKVVAEIRGDINAKRINQNNALGAAILALKNNLLNPENFEILSELIVQWQKNDLSPEARLIFEQRVSLVIEKMKPNLEIDLSSQFDNLAADNFLRNVQLGASYSKEVLEATVGCVLSLTKPALLVSSDHQANELPCKKLIDNEVMKKLCALLISKDLTEQEFGFIKEVVFAELRAIDTNLVRQVWVGHSSDVMRQCCEENVMLKSELARLAEQVNQLMKSQPEAVKPVQNVETKGDDKPSSLSGYMLFGKK